MKQKILDNVSEYSARQLVEYIKAGIVTFDELIQDTEGEFSVEKRREVKQLLDSGDADEWNKVKRLRTIEDVQHYLDTFPTGKFRDEARALKRELVEEKNKDTVRIRISGNNADELVTLINHVPEDKSLITQKQKDDKTIALIEEFLNEKKITKLDFLEKIKEDHNLLSSGIVKRLIDSEILSEEDLTSIGIDTLFIQKMYGEGHSQVFSTPQKLYKINKQSTEIYFWGIPSSGKSCALGAILSVADSGRIAHSMDKDTNCQGYGYMCRLINLFQDNTGVVTLMEGTPVDSFYEMGFDLVDEKDKIHPITLIDMAGELMRCMYKSNAGEDISETETVMLDTLTKVLIANRTINRKIHFFVIEYGAENRLYEGLPQRTYLDGTVSYIKNTGIFRKDTDAIYIMITKVDKVRYATKNVRDVLTDYVYQEYRGFYNNLEQICKDNDINKGKVEKVAFSLGKVCFQNYCMLDFRPAENIVRQFLQRTASFKGGRRGKLEKIFRG